MRARLWVLRAASFSLLLLASSAHAAEGTQVETLPAAPGHQRPHLVLGMKAVSTIERAITRERIATLSGYGFASVAETAVLDGRLGIELDFVFTAPDDELTMAGEPMLKLPWHLRTWFEPYLAAGPLVIRVHDDRGQHFWLGGGQVVAGAFLWLAELGGLDLDLSLGAAHGPGMSVTELTVAIGPVLRD